MPRDLSRLEIDRVIFHDVPARRAGSAAVPTLSEIEAPLGTAALNFFRRRLVGTLTRNAFPVVFQDSTMSVVPSLTSKSLSGASQDFVRDSQGIAMHLFNMQPGSSPPGMLAVAECRLSVLRAFAIVKLEHDEGTRALPDNSQGRLTFVLEHLQDLMLTEKARVFKAGLFIQEGADVNSIGGYVSDNQSGQWSRRGVADYFLRRFLGCELREDPALVTQNFLMAAEDWINTAISDPDKQAGYMIAVLTEMRRNVDTINPRSFALDHLAEEDRQGFVAHLDDSTVPTNAFQKNIDLVSPRLRRVSINLESGLIIFGDPDVFTDRVQMRTLDDGQAEIIITDRVKNMRSRG